MRGVRLLTQFLMIATGAAVCAVVSHSVAGDLAALERPVEEVVDLYIDAGLTAAGVTPAAAADDANFIRRVTLDLAGRIPAASEVTSYVQSTEADKKAKLVERLLASPDFAFHQRNEYDVMLMVGKGSGEWRDWLLKGLEESRPWPQTFREIVLPREDNPAGKAAAAVPEVARRQRRRHDERHQPALLRRQHQLCQVPRPSARPRLDAGPLLRHGVVLQSHVSDEEEFPRRARRRQLEVPHDRRRGEAGQAGVPHDRRNSRSGIGRAD